ncbi:CehA/McbA family metallohydrolase [Stieleria tagensis]|uniref:CehA/McbA family metallohydrolase n=1 Tax=Stieleria tagensis TaxID=2956795 RepID=UPI00209B160E|nr:CehA/McbA family metallohydrolase [Stieleria tagensis]
MDGKEVDWIYGDYEMSNDLLSLTIAAPLATRDANLTVRDIGASILDLTLNTPSNDQLSAFIPAAARYQFHDPSLVETGGDEHAVYWRCQSSRSLKEDETTATVTYRLVDGEPFVRVMVVIDGETASAVKPYDGFRADRTFKFDSLGRMATCSDSFFRQTLGVAVEAASTPPSWVSKRPAELHYSAAQVQKSDNQISWSIRLYPATSLLDLNSVADAESQPVAMQTLQVQSALPAFDGQAMMRALLSVTGPGQTENDQASRTLETDDQGVAHVRLAPGTYSIKTSAIGFQSSTTSIEVTEQSQSFPLPLSGFSGIIATATDGDGQSIPTKATLYRVDGDAPDYGPDSTRTFIKNVVYSVHGRMRCPLDPGNYEIYFSHGPEFNSVKKAITVKAGQVSEIVVQLQRVVDTTGWVSVELHSHSSPSGDNVSDQFGRVENLLCEHLEFAPCTEHNRISSYVPHLKAMQLLDQMATCSGMELTGRPLPINHQNAFPLHHHPHTQNGGGPRTDANPVVQIERLAMWDNGSDKLVQQNHPNLHQIHGDLDIDGTADEGFRGMLQWMDVVEVHPLTTIFDDIVSKPPNVREMKIPLFQWLQLLNHGYRIPGVINTDAHYNHHGSGWRRNWFLSSTDDPATISTEEMVRQAEAGHIIMSTGPFLTVEAKPAGSAVTAIPGDDLSAAGGKVAMNVRVQCPNWLDVNRVQLFINGRPSVDHNWTRKTAPGMFADSTAVTKFDLSFAVKLDSDAHLIIATIGEGMTMDKVMGPQYGNRPPIAVSNPIFVDIDGDGFHANGDDLGLPLPGAIAGHQH